MTVRHPTLLATSLLLLLGVALAGAAPAFKRTAVGEILHDFELTGPSGEALRLAESLGAKATVLVFWATWNPRSAQVLGDLQEMYAEQAANGLKVLAVNAENAEWDPATLERIAGISQQTGLTYPVLVDRDLTVYNEYGVVALPSMVLADSAGKIIELRQGYPTAARLEFRDSILTALGVLQPAQDEAAAASPDSRVSPKVRRRVEMARLLLERKRPSRAVEALKQAIGEDPTYTEAYRLLAQALEKMGMDAEAQAARDKLAQLEQPTPTATETPAAAAGPAEGSQAAPQRRTAPARP